MFCKKNSNIYTENHYGSKTNVPRAVKVYFQKFILTRKLLCKDSVREIYKIQNLKNIGRIMKIFNWIVLMYVRGIKLTNKLRLQSNLSSIFSINI